MEGLSGHVEKSMVGSPLSTSSLSLRHVEVFRAVMSSASVTEAAALLHTSQPTVSRELKQIERVLGFALFERRGRRLQATDQAIALYSEVKRSYSGLDQIVRAAAAIRDFALSHLRIASLPVFSQTILPPACERFHAEHPAVRLTLHTLEQPSLLRETMAQRYDVGLIEVGGRIEGLSLEEIAVGNQICILPRQHPLAQKEKLEPDDFHGVGFIYFSEDDVHRSLLDQAFDSAGTTRSLTIEASTSAVVCNLVERGLGVSIINPLSALNCDRERVALRRFSVPIPYTIGMISDARRGSQPLNLKLREALIEESSIIRAEVSRRLAEEARNLRF
jgi:DNA-binding transcriptional LysR family regulator